ncbi:MAG: metal transporter [Deltaproteobacteria bacterium]
MMTRSNHDEGLRNPLLSIEELPARLWLAGMQSIWAGALYWYGLFNYRKEFFEFLLAETQSFERAEVKRWSEEPLGANVADYARLLGFNVMLASVAWQSSLQKALGYHFREFQRFAFSLLNTLEGAEGETVDQFMAEEAEALKRVAIEFPDAIRDIEAEYGFHFETEGYLKIAETERMNLYQVLPTESGVEVQPELKPVLTAHPYVLGPNILAFLPGERKSYVHAFANQGIPTYIRVIKDIDSNPAVQVMRGEDDVLDTRQFLHVIREKHNKPVTLNGVCQGGFILVAGLLTGEFEDTVDAIITVASPIDGTRSKTLEHYLKGIIPRFRDLAYATKILPSGNEVVDGKIMSWVYKLMSIDKEEPLYTYYQDLDRFEEDVRHGVREVCKTAAAINHWLIYDRIDQPIEITNLSKLSYRNPISPDGDLPIKLFGRTLNLKYVTEKGIKWLICYGENDRLVEPPAALAPRDFIDTEITAFPKGHAAVLTHWSHPDSEYALQKKFENGQRGPVRFQLDLSEG